MFILSVILALFTWTNPSDQLAFPGPKSSIEDSTLVVPSCTDFTISGKGDNGNWNAVGWSPLGKKVDSGGKNYQSRFKMMYSSTGIYLLFEGEDEKITTKAYKDFEEIYEGDVYEVFFQPDAAIPIYFEYEINHLGKELILTLARSNKKSIAWAPWNYEYSRDKLVQKKVFVEGGKATPGGKLKSWTAEFFFPNELFGVMQQRPASGTQWKANFCRIDYDSGKMIQWSWSNKIERDFHEIENFGTILFK